MVHAKPGEVTNHHDTLLYPTAAHDGDCCVGAHHGYFCSSPRIYMSWMDPFALLPTPHVVVEPFALFLPPGTIRGPARLQRSPLAFYPGAGWSGWDRSSEEEGLGCTAPCPCHAILALPS